MRGRTITEWLGDFIGCLCLFGFGYAMLTIEWWLPWLDRCINQ